MSRKKRKQEGSCVYCGAIGAMTNDHVFPKCLFERPLPANMPVVQSCQKCNNVQKNSNDTFLRDMLVQDMAASQNRVAQNLVSGPVNRAMKRNQSAFSRNRPLISVARPYFDPYGNFDGYSTVDEVDSKRVDELFGFIARGLYYFTFKQRVPDYIKINPIRLEIHQVIHKLMPIMKERAQPLNAAGDKIIRLGQSVSYVCLKGNHPHFHVNAFVACFFEAIYVVMAFMEPVIRMKDGGRIVCSIHQEHNYTPAGGE